MMIVPRPNDIRHKIQMLNLLSAILKSPLLASALVFKGGTYAALRGFLDRFSVDLDFDIFDNSRVKEVRKVCYEMFSDLGLKIKDESTNYLQFFLQYEAPMNERNTLKLEINDQVSAFATFEPVFLNEIKIYCNGHTTDTMFAYKLIAAKARFDNTGHISGRDFYDIAQFCYAGFDVNKAVIKDVTGLEFVSYIDSLLSFIDNELSDKVLYEDLNPLLDAKRLNASVKNLKTELVFLLPRLRKLAVAY